MAAMDELAVLLKVKEILVATTWPASADTVFGTNRVRITAGVPLDAVVKLRTPCALIKPGSGTADQDEPLLLETRFTISVIHMAAGDEIGENVLLGSHARVERGLLYAARQMLLAISKLNRDDLGGAKIMVVGRDSGEASLDEQSLYIAWRAYTFLMRVGLEVP